MSINPLVHQVLVPIKAVPGASRDQIAGMLADRVKIRIRSAPEAGKANASICALIADTLNIKHAHVSVHKGHTSPEKMIAITNSRYKTTHDAIDALLATS